MNGSTRRTISEFSGNRKPNRANSADAKNARLISGFSVDLVMSKTKVIYAEQSILFAKYY
jgi:hypothetical protein